MDERDILERLERYAQSVPAYLNGMDWLCGDAAKEIRTLREEIKLLRQPDSATATSSSQTPEQKPPGQSR